MKSVLSERKTLHPQDIERRELPSADGQAVRALAREICTTLAAQPGGVGRALTNPALAGHIDRWSTELPGTVREAMRAPATSAGATIVSSLPLSDDELGPTPHSWREAVRWSELDIVMLLLARCAGEPFGWQGQQDGRLVNNILPTPGHEDEQSGASSKALLSPHTEDAFHPQRANLLMLGCLRNPDLVGTTVSSVRRVVLSADEHRLLRTPTLPILPDVSYGTGHERHTAPPLPTIWSETLDGTADLTLRYDPAYTPLDDAGPEFRAAYAHLTAELERVCVTAALHPGELLLVDNDVAVHGRVPFTARYDGTDRWLKRVNIRLPERRRRAAEADENGYGQRIVAPFAGGARPAESARADAVAGAGWDRDDRGSVEHS
ncbi:TauD/TfdA family dioxygenase [Nocardia goodfellowii]|uniref:Alpha-ketoglutarate-dependent taurine dioxygenase n=1 Tax=Nocardia goodfellowii TaxID=882446 RepID=A0ABS4QBN8_9NOCA|nr:TauD/TfdA family dioxygenase [Nocardia goodfellowii]MBP2189111.1 alpha-ketoglutarate-dependent taurine dioxygenase [Nocardia goodfellowii]